MPGHLLAITMQGHTRNPKASDAILSVSILPVAVTSAHPDFRFVHLVRLGVDLFWDDTAAVRIQRAFSKLTRPPKHDQRLLDFMRDKCDFDSEHADGTYLLFGVVLPQSD